MGCFELTPQPSHGITADKSHKEWGRSAVAQSTYEEARRKLDPDVRELLDAYMEHRRQKWIVGGAATVVAAVAALGGFLAFVQANITETAKIAADAAIEELEVRKEANATLVDTVKEAAAAEAEIKQARDDLQEAKNELEETQRTFEIAQMNAIEAANESKKAADENFEKAKIESEDLSQIITNIRTEAERSESIAKEAASLAEEKHSDIQKLSENYQNILATFGGIEQINETLREALEGNNVSEELVRKVINEEASSAKLPLGAVLAFDRSEGCPEGWAQFADAAGRSLVGVGKGQGLSNRSYRSIGGEETHTLTVTEMPTHNHDTQGYQYLLSIDGEGAAMPHDRARSWPNIQRPGQIQPAGGSAPHNNMPPFIALYFCKYEGTS